MSSQLKSVIRHEYFTVVKQLGFIFSMLGVPLLILAVFAIGHFTEQTREATAEDTASDIQDVVIIDKSGIIQDETLAGLDYQLRDSGEDEAIEQVRQEELDGVIVYPDNVLESRQFDVYIADDGFLANSILSDIGQDILVASIVSGLENEDVAILLQQGATGNVTTFQDGQERAGFVEYVVPGAFMVLFFFILFFTMSYMLLGVSEEKENRSMEMMLTYLRPRTLITGKLLAIGLVGLTQFLFFLLLGIGVYFVITGTDLVTLPFDIDLSGLVFDPIAIVAGLLILVFGFLLFAAVMSGVAAMMPGVKEANSLSGVFYLLAFVPFWAMEAIVAAPNAAIVTFLSYFPLTSPTTLMLRNTLGNISTVELALAVVTLMLFTFLSFLLAAKLFRLGALEYNDRVKLTKLLSK